MADEQRTWGSPTPIDHAPDASYGTYLENDHQGARHGLEGYVGYGDEDLLFGPMPSTHDTGACTSSESETGWYSTGPYGTYQDGTGTYNSTAAPDHVQSAHQGSYNTGGCETTAMWDATGYPGASSRVVGADVADTSGHGEPARWVDSIGQWHTGRLVPSCLGSEAQPHTLSTNPYADPYAPFDPTASPGSPGSPAEESPGQTSHQPVPEPEHERTALFAPLPGEPEDTSQATSEDKRAAPPTSRRVDARNRQASARRSALLTVAVPSVAVMGMTGVAAVSVSVDDEGKKATQAAPDTTPAIDPSAANGEIDAQFNGLTTNAHDFADRASRTQERIDLRQRHLEEQRRRAAEAAHRKAEAARKEALRPKFALPVAQRGVGELFGASGSMWSNRHTGLDFPVPMNTPVMAVTDGTVEAKWNQFYGNMVIVTAPDGTETWYCHLASAKIRAGQVKAGDVIAYAGSSGNSSGPHLHLEVHPGGGDAIDPLAWLRSHGLDPT